MQRRVNTQYVELKKFKDSLPTTSLLLQMYFAENFSCSSGPRNVPSSYWNPQTVTLHPIMVYCRGGAAAEKFLLHVAGAFTQHDHGGDDPEVPPTPGAPPPN